MVNIKDTSWFQSRFAEIAPRLEDAGTNGSLGDGRREALSRFEELGLPTLRHEDWKYTSVAAIGKTRFVRAEGAAPSPQSVEALRVDGLEGPRLVFVDGRFSPELSSIGDLPAGVTVASLGEAARDDATAALLRQHLSSLLDDYADHPFAHLAAALWEDGVLVHVAPGAVLEAPIHALFVSSRSESPSASFPRILAVVEANAQATLFEDYASAADESVTLSNALIEVQLGENATFEHIRALRENAGSYHVSALACRQARSSRFHSTAVSTGGALVRNDVHVRLEGEDCETTLNGLIVGTDEQLLDNHTRIVHAQPHCRSWELYKAVLADRSTGVFNGKIYVDQIAQKTDAKQTNQSLLLSEKATINSKPELEIYADDVKCTHGATIGYLDEDALFYLRSRGIDRETAQNILTHAFASDVFAQVPSEPIRRALEELLYDKLPQAAALRTED